MEPVEGQSMSAKGGEEVGVRAESEEAGAFRKEALVRIGAEKAAWEKGTLRESLAAKPELKEEFRSGSGEVVVKRLYTPLDMNESSYEKDLGFPGQSPFTRGVHPAGNRARVESLIYYSGFGSPENANQRYRSLIDQGGTSIRLALDLPTQIGYDSDNPLSCSEVGKVGVAIDSLADMERLFEGIPLEKIEIGTTGNCIGPVMLAFYLGLAEKRGVDYKSMAAHLQNDPLKEYTGRGTYIFPVRIAIALAADVVEFCHRSVPHWLPQFPCTTQMRWGGCSAAQEIAFGLAALIAYLEAASERGVALENLMPKMHWHATSDNDLFEEAAKFRAGRRLWAKIVRERFKTNDPRILGLRITAWTGSHRLTAQQPLNNIVRTAIHVLACMLGGVEEIHSPAHDEALALPTVQSTRLAAVTKHILHFESGLGNTVDPLGGAYYVESLTDQLEAQAQDCFRKVEAMGGIIAAVESGYILKEMADGMYRYQKEVESGKRVIVGINKDELTEELPIETFVGDPEAEQRQIERLTKMKSERNNELATGTLGQLKIKAAEKAKQHTINLVEPILEAVRAYATIGEICGVLREVFGEYSPIRYF
jgi:methylmalonyl-CoA mutase N-terminal domain/subunit